jgi:hypothetical protein
VVNTDGVTAEFRLSESLSPASEYQATITKDVKDLVGHSMLEDNRWSFKTEIGSSQPSTTTTATQPSTTTTATQPSTTYKTKAPVQPS